MLWWFTAMHDMPDAIAWQLLETVSRADSSRVFIDGLDAFQSLFVDERRTSLFHAALRAELAARGATTILSETLCEEPFSPTAMPFVDNVIALVETAKRQKLRRSVVVRKLQGCAHDMTLRRLRISSEGIEVDQAELGTRRRRRT